MIRKLEAKDLKEVLRLVKELAAFEKEPEAVVAQLDEYEQLFHKGLFDGFVAVQDEKVVGMAVYYPIFSTWKGKMLYLEDFYVESDYRNGGFGQQLFNAFIEEAKAQGCRRVKWQVLDWNTDAIRFYERNNAFIDTSWCNGTIDLK